MKGIIIYYSNTGNTLLACRYLAHKIPNAEFSFHNVLREKEIDLEPFDIIGFATFTDAWDVPKIFVDYITRLQVHNKKWAFLLNTYGFISGKTLKAMNQHVTDKGLQVLCGHSLHTPENFPPMIRLGLGCAQHPGKSEFKKFNEFITSLAGYIDALDHNNIIVPRKISIGLLNNILPAYPQSTIQPMMGDKMVDEELCSECGLCAKNCPGSAITLSPKPVFDDGKCHYCWACYNKCPQKAVFTTKFRGKYHYPAPNQSLKEKLKSV